MALRIGIVGLPNSGKSTLFNALLKRQAARVENRPFTTIEPNVGVVEVPDPRLTELAAIVKPKAVIPATVEFVDIAGLVKGAHQGVGLGNQFLSHIREVDAIIILLRAFVDPGVTHVEGKVDPENDLEILLLELGLADEAHPEAPKLLEKPRLIVQNVDESQLSEQSEDTKRSEVRVSAKIEAELASLSEDDQLALLSDLGLTEPPLNRVIRESYQLLGLITLFTAGPKEVRAWTVRRGAKAPEAAARIHTDMERGFIRAEVISFADFVQFGREQGLPAGRAGTKAAGKLRTEGKDYVVQDGEVIHVRFNV